MDRGFYHNQNNEIVFTGNRKPLDHDGLIWKGGMEESWPAKLFEYGHYTSIFDGSNIIENPVYTSGKPDIEEKKQIVSDLNNALAWQFKMIRELFELGVSKGLWSGSDITDQELKQKYAEWNIKLNRLDELDG